MGNEGKDGGTSDERRRRLAAELRANLARRKAQKRARRNPEKDGKETREPGDENGR